VELDRWPAVGTNYVTRHSFLLSSINANSHSSSSSVIHSRTAAASAQAKAEAEAAQQKNCLTRTSTMARKKAVAAKPKPNDLFGQLVYNMWRDSGALQRHLDAGHSINATDEFGDTVLHVSCFPDVETMSKCSDTLVKQLLQAGADPNCRNRRGYLFVHSAADDIHARTAERRTPL
jgi:hypothetical protein